NALPISCIVSSIGGVFLCAHVSFSSAAVDVAVLAAPGVWPWLLMVFSGVMATAVCNVIWNRAIAGLGVARTSVFQYWIPVFGVGFAMLLLGEPFSWWHLVGLVGSLLGTYLGTRRPRIR